MLVESGSGNGSAGRVPDTLQALIAARIDHLDPAAKTLLQRGSVVGRVFWRGALEHLSPDVEGHEALLDDLLQREFLLREPRSSISGEVAYRFKHALIREVAYSGMAKLARAQYHARFAEWLAETNGRGARGDSCVPPRPVGRVPDGARGRAAGGARAGDGGARSSRPRSARSRARRTRTRGRWRFERSSFVRRSARGTSRRAPPGGSRTGARYRSRWPRFENRPARRAIACTRRWRSLPSARRRSSATVTRHGRERSSTRLSRSSPATRMRSPTSTR